jgi:phosphoglycolate phosphatase
MSVVRGVLFDLDGTLLDSAPDLVGSLNHVRQTEGLDALPVPDMSPHASKGALGLLNAGMPAADEQTLERWRLRFLEHYSQNSFRESSLYEGVAETLEYLARSAIPWGIVTNKVESLTLPLVDRIGWRQSVGCVVCGDTLAQSKPHPEPVLLACNILRVDPARVLFVGDDVRDVQAGLAAGTLTAAAQYGYGSHEFAQAEQRAHVDLDTLQDLITLIANWNRSSGTGGAGSD